VQRLGEVTDFALRRGEINQTTLKRWVVDDPMQTKLLKGAEVSPFGLQPPRQGGLKWFDEKGYADHASEKTHRARRTLAGSRRIATQRITGINDTRRLIATIVEPPMYFADSTNCIANKKGDLEFLLALLNSELWQLRFRITSTNNNVQTNELEGLPFRNIDLTDATDRQLHEEITTGVSKLMRLMEMHEMLSGVDADHNQQQMNQIQSQIDQLVYRAYGLGQDDIDLVRQTLYGSTNAVPNR